MSNVLKDNACIKVLDISSNPDVTGESIKNLGEVFTTNRSIEYLGMSKLKLEASDIKPLFEMIGTFPFPEDQVEN